MCKSPSLDKSIDLAGQSRNSSLNATAADVHPASQVMSKLEAFLASVHGFLNLRFEPVGCLWVGKVTLMVSGR